MRTADRLWPLAVALPAFVAGPIAAHDFWMQPARFRILAGQQVDLRFLIGEQDAVEHWATEWQKVVSLQDFAPSQVHDELAAIRPLEGRKPAIDRIDASISLPEPGTHVIALTSALASSDLPAAAFNAYAAHEGLNLILADRKRTGRSDRHGRELYSRRAKALIQVGSTPTDTVSTPIGQTLEIVPEANPLLLAHGTPLCARIRFHGAALSGATVALERLGKDGVHATTAISDADGRVCFTLPIAGTWKLNVVWSYPVVDPRADYETIFSSLTFEM